MKMNAILMIIKIFFFTSLLMAGVSTLLVVVGVAIVISRFHLAAVGWRGRTTTTTTLFHRPFHRLSGRVFVVVLAAAHATSKNPKVGKMTKYRTQRN